MAIGTKIGPDGRPIDEGFFGLGNALASLPGTPVLPGGGAPPDLTGTPPSTAPPGYGAGYTEPDDPYRINEGPGFPSRGSGTPSMPPEGGQTYTPPGPGSLGYQGTGWGNTPQASGRQTGEPGGSRTGTPQTNPGLPPPASTAGTGGFWGDQNPWAQNVGASINDQPVSFASPGNPNPNYVTPEAAQKIGQTFGANVVSQNLNNMSSPGSSAPSAPIYGLDFGRGDIQGADVAATGLARGDTPQQIAERYAAGLNTKAWAGDVPVPTTARADADGMWNYSTPVSTYDPSQSNAQQAQLIQWLKGQIGQA